MLHRSKDIPPETRLRGRASDGNETGRFERLTKEAVDDGWEQTEDLPVLRTHVSEERPRSVITRNASPDLSFDQSINPYRGCEHGCIYCFARPTHAYLGLSPGLDFESQLVARPDAAKVLDRELRRKGYNPRPLAIGTNTDPYQPIEKQYRIMRSLLKVLDNFRHPVGIVTKGTLIERDTDILGPMAASGLARVGISITTLDASLSRQMEPRVPAPKRRLHVIETLSKAGIPVRVCVSPTIPGLTDHEMEAILTHARDAGAVAATYIPLRLPLEVSPLFQDWLSRIRPNAAGKVMSLVRQMHGGEDYSSEFGTRMTGSGPYADVLKQRFRMAVKRLGLQEKLPPLRCDQFTVPFEDGHQLSLF